jgi:lipoate-protein ligase B
MDAIWLDLGFLEYLPAFAIQEQALAARLDGRLPPTVILQENPPTFTIGRTGSPANILLAPAELERRGVQVVEVNRGGDVTYHGPGQLIASPLLYLGELGMNGNQYLHRLEDVLIELLAGWDIRAGKTPDAPGVWVGPAKIASVGIAVRHGYTFHGFSLNVNLDLTPFDWINPCGMPKLAVTSIERLSGRPVSMAEAREALRKALSRTFHLDLRAAGWAELQAALRAGSAPQMNSGNQTQ